MKNVGYRLRKARWEKNISIYRISKVSGLDKKIIMNIELRNTNCRIDTLYKICECTGISADYLLGLSDNTFLNV